MRLPFPWDPDEMLGVGPAQQAACSVPDCGKPPNGGRGLCNSCYQAWKRGGLEGLARRASRLSEGTAIVRSPLDKEAAKDALIALASEAVLKSETDEDFDRYRERLWRLAAQCGQLEARLERQKHHAHTKDRYVEKHGIDAWRARLNEAKARYRQRLRERAGKEAVPRPHGVQKVMATESDAVIVSLPTPARPIGRGHTQKEIEHGGRTGRDQQRREEGAGAVRGREGLHAGRGGRAPDHHGGGAPLGGPEVRQEAVRRAHPEGGQEGVQEGRREGQGPEGAQGQGGEGGGPGHDAVIAAQPGAQPKRPGPSSMQTEDQNSKIEDRRQTC